MNEKINGMSAPKLQAKNSVNSKKVSITPKINL